MNDKQEHTTKCYTCHNADKDGNDETWKNYIFMFEYCMIITTLSAINTKLPNCNILFPQYLKAAMGRTMELNQERYLRWQKLLWLRL